MKIFFSFQVETVGQIYMAACGAPEKTDLHAQNIADLALAMIENIQKIKTVDNKEVEIRIGTVQKNSSLYFHFSFNSF